jgi:hypothetical protein
MRPGAAVWPRLASFVAEVGKSLQEARATGTSLQRVV